MDIRIRKAWTSSKRLFEAIGNASEHLWIPTKFVVWQSTHDPIDLLLNEPDALQQRERTRLWRESKIAELTAAAYTVRSLHHSSSARFSSIDIENPKWFPQSALTASVVAGAFSWTSTASFPWTTRAIWYSSLVMALISITTSTQQSILLHRMGSHAEGLNRLQNLLRSKNAIAAGGVVPAKARPIQLYVWQIPVNLLNVSIFLFIIGLAIQIFAMAFRARDDSKIVWTDEKKVKFKNLLELFGLIFVSLTENLHSSRLWFVSLLRASMA